MDIAKLRLPAWTEHDGQRLVLDPKQVQADMNEAADEIARLELANRQSMAQADLRSAENCKLRQENERLTAYQNETALAWTKLTESQEQEIERLRDIARDARDHVPPDVLARIDAALGANH